MRKLSPKWDTSTCQEPVSIRDPDPEKSYSLKCIRVELQKAIMRFLQVGPLSKFSWMAALPGGAGLAHTEVCACDTRGRKEPDWVSGELGSVLSPHSWAKWPWVSKLTSLSHNLELCNRNNEVYCITHIKFESYKIPSNYKLMLLFLTATILRKLLKILGALEMIFSPCQTIWNLMLEKRFQIIKDSTNYI